MRCMRSCPTPLLWRFLQEVPRREDAWAAAVVGRLTQLCGEHLQAVWKVRLTATEAPALRAWLAEGGARLGDLLRNPDDRERASARGPTAARPCHRW